MILGTGKILNEVLLKIADFIRQHSKHGDVIVDLDIVPDVIRFDCFICLENLQVRYQKEEENGTSRP